MSRHVGPGARAAGCPGSVDHLHATGAARDAPFESPDVSGAGLETSPRTTSGDARCPGRPPARSQLALRTCSLATVGMVDWSCGTSAGGCDTRVWACPPSFTRACGAEPRALRLMHAEGPLGRHESQELFFLPTVQVRLCLESEVFLPKLCKRGLILKPRFNQSILHVDHLLLQPADPCLRLPVVSVRADRLQRLAAGSRVGRWVTRRHPDATSQNEQRSAVTSSRNEEPPRRPPQPAAQQPLQPMHFARNPQNDSCDAAGTSTHCGENSPLFFKLMSEALHSVKEPLTSTTRLRAWAVQMREGILPRMLRSPRQHTPHRSRRRRQKTFQALEVFVMRCGLNASRPSFQGIAEEALPRHCAQDQKRTKYVPPLGHSAPPQRRRSALFTRAPCACALSLRGGGTGPPA